MGFREEGEGGGGSGGRFQGWDISIGHVTEKILNLKNCILT